MISDLSQAPKHKPRSSGFECPWNIYQILSYIYFASTSITFLIKLVPFTQASMKLPYLILFSLLSTLIIYYTITLTKSNPTDPEVIAFKKSQREK